MIEITPTTQLPVWPAYLDGNIDLWEPQQLDYLDGNYTLAQPEVPVVLDSYIENLSEEFFIEESFQFINNGQAILLSDNILVVNGNNITYNGIQIDLTLPIQTIQSLIVIKAKTPGYYVWTLPGLWGDFLVPTGIYEKNITSDDLGTDRLFCKLFPYNREFILVSQADSSYKVKGAGNNVEEKTSGDRPLEYNIVSNVWYDDRVIAYKANYPWVTDSYTTISLDRSEERLKLFILIDNSLYWANVTFVTDGLYEINHLSFTEDLIAMSYGTNIVVIKNYNKLQVEII